MELNEIEQLSSWLKASKLCCLEFSRPGEVLKLFVSESRHVEVIDSSDALESRFLGHHGLSQIDVITQTAGIYLSTHPMREKPFVTVGSFVKMNTIVGLLKIGLIYAPILTPKSGVVMNIISRTGDLLGYGSKVLTLKPESE